MAYSMKFYVDGGCRSNGQQGAYGAAAAVLVLNTGETKAWTRELPYHSPTPTNQRAELTAIIMALEIAQQEYVKLHQRPYLELTIHSDSAYAVNCMNQWVSAWSRTGWTTVHGRPVANRDLLEDAEDLESLLMQFGEITYKHVRRAENCHADQYCNEAMDRMRDEMNAPCAFVGTVVAYACKY